MLLLLLLLLPTPTAVRGCSKLEDVDDCVQERAYHCFFICSVRERGEEQRSGIGLMQGLAVDNGGRLIFHFQTEC